MFAEEVVVDREYLYLGQYVEVVEIHGQEDWADVVIENRFGERTTIKVTELSPKTGTKKPELLSAPRRNRFY